jgi:hypothetical protein
MCLAWLEALKPESQSPGFAQPSQAKVRAWSQGFDLCIISAHTSHSQYKFYSARLEGQSQFIEFLFEGFTLDLSHTSNANQELAEINKF